MKKKWKPIRIFTGFHLEIKAHRKSFPLTLIGYIKDQLMVLTRLVNDDDVDIFIPVIFEKHPDIEHSREIPLQVALFVKLKEVNYFCYKATPATFIQIYLAFPKLIQYKAISTTAILACVLFSSHLYSSNQLNTRPR